MAQKKKLPKDTNKKAKSVVDMATSDGQDISTNDAKSIAAQLGRRGGLKGGKARAKKLTKAEIVAIAKKGAAARWGHKTG